MADDCANAYGELEALVDSFGFPLEELAPSEIILSSVETTNGPGIMLSVRHRIDDEEPDEEAPN